MKRQREFFAADAMSCQEAQEPGTEEKVLSRDTDDPAVLTRLVRWAPGLDTSDVGVITHDYVEEVYLLEGELTDLTLGRTFRAGHYASRRPGMRHGPYHTPTGCTMLEIRYRVTAR
jgi:ChrR Cupin-like domain